MQLVEQPDGLWDWEIVEVPSYDDSEVAAVAEAVNEGLTIQKIVQRTGLTKS